MDEVVAPALETTKTDKEVNGGAEGDTTNEVGLNLPAVEHCLTMTPQQPQ